MKRRTLDYIFAAGGAVLAVLLLVLGFVLADQAAFASDYVKDQLGQQRITFTAADKLTDEEKNWKPGSSCLSDNGGKLMETGKQAECYANYYIAMHMRRSAANAKGVDGKAYGWDNETYATMGTIQTDLRAQVADAKAKNNTDATNAAQEKLDDATALRSTFQTGETLRGLLLTSYGFSIFGEKAELASNVCYLAGGLLILLSIAGFVHALRTSEDTLVGAPAGFGKKVSAT